jgi:type IV fimbrial biogenesis protein FimT
VAAWRRGFTLLEMVVVLAIAAILGAIATPSFSGLIERQRLQAVAHHLQADIALARQEASRRGQTVHLSFSAGPQWCWALAAGSGIDCRQARAAPGGGAIKVVRAPDFPGVTLLGATAMAIDNRSGTSLLAEGHADFAASGGQQLQVRLGRLGRASLCAPAAPVSGTPPCPDSAPH